MTGTEDKPARGQLSTTMTQRKSKPGSESLTPIRRRQRSRQQRLEIQAAELLELHPHFRGRGRLVEFRCNENCLTMIGCLPSYYLKQLAQEAIREIGDVEVDNQIVVSGMIGNLVPPEKDQRDKIDIEAVKRIPR